MAWTELTRRQHARSGKRYASDLTDAEWALIAPLMPPVKTTGRPRTTRCFRRDPLHRDDRLPVADVAQ
jgi:transposase